MTQFLSFIFLILAITANVKSDFISKVLPPLNRNYQEFYLEMTEMFTSAETSSAEQFIGDGNVRPIWVFNRTLPGPTLVAYSGSEVRITVKNELKVPTAVHWHGIHMKDRFFYDGVVNISQPQIEPNGVMTYELKITNSPGTYWYHSHNGFQRGNGLYGALVILDPNDNSAPIDDFVLLVTDWWKEPAEEFEENMNNSMITRDQVGQFMSDVKFHSFLANGRGWEDSQQLLTSRILSLPLENLAAQCSDKPVRLRLINVGFVFSFQLRVAGHKLRFLATDGIDVDLQAELFDSVVVQGGERYDLHLIPTEEAKQFDTFRIRISTLEKFDENLHPLDADLHFTDVLLLCKGAKLPTVKLMNLTEEKCRADAKCRVLNCPFEQFPLNSNQTCVNPTEFRSTDAWLNRPVDETHFLNFGGIENEEYHTINNIKMGMPTFPPFLHSGPIGEVAPECEKDCGSKRRCECFQPIKIELGHVVQLVFYNKISAPSSNAQSGMGHPVHLHGYHFRVIKVGYPKRDANGIVGDMSNDITCDHLNCTDERWAAATWNEVIPGANLAHPVSKDTIFVPFGGYAVVRFVADNPGWFVLHCHILMHEAEGMMRAVQVGNENQIPKPPKGYPNVPCHSGADHRYVGLLSILLGIFLVCA